MRTFPAIPEPRLGHGQLVENFLCRTVENLPLFGENQAAGVAVKEGHFETFLQPANLPADRRLAEIERLAGMGEAARFGDHLKDTKLVPIHDLPHPIRPDQAVAPAAVSRSPRKRSACKALMQPVPAAVTACR